MILIDQIGQNHTFNSVPNRIVSLVPSITEFLYDLGLKDRLVGCTKFCLHPVGLKQSITQIGGTKKVNIDRIKELGPDIIIANKEENTKEDVEKIKEVCPVWVTDIATMEDSFEMMRSLGQVFHKQEKVNLIVRNTEEVIGTSITSSHSVVYLIWRKPYMTIGGDTYISNVMERFGFYNSFNSRNRYPEVSIQDIHDVQPDHIFLSSEPFPFKQKHLEELQKELGIDSIHLVNGEFFSWYGTRIMNSKNYINELMASL